MRVLNADLLGLTKMAVVIITLKIMPASPDEDLSRIEKEAKRHIKAFAGPSKFRVSVEPVAFGLNSVNITFAMDEDKGSTEQLERKISSVDGVGSVDVTDVRRAVG